MVNYADILREIANRVNAVVGNTTVLKTASLAADPLTSTQIGSVDFPFTSLTRAAISGVARIHRAIAFTKNHPFRIESQTASIAHKALIPSTNSASKPIVGVYGAIKDATSGELLTEQPVQIIESIIKSKTDASLKGEYHYYKIASGRIYHTRTNVVIDVVTFDLSDEKSKVTTVGGLTPLPDACFDLAWCAALALLVTDDAYTAQAQAAEIYVQNELNQLKQGAANFLPAAELINTASPSVS